MENLYISCLSRAGSSTSSEIILSLLIDSSTSRVSLYPSMCIGMETNLLKWSSLSKSGKNWLNFPIEIWIDLTSNFLLTSFSHTRFSAVHKFTFPCNYSIFTFIENVCSSKIWIKIKEEVWGSLVDCWWDEIDLKRQSSCFRWQDRSYRGGKHHGRRAYSHWKKREG